MTDCMVDKAKMCAVGSSCLKRGFIRSEDNDKCICNEETHLNLYD